MNKQKAPVGREVSARLLSGFFNSIDFGLLHRPLARKGRQVVQAFQQVSAQCSDHVAAAIVIQQACGTKLFDPGVQRVWCDVADAVLQQAKRLGMSVFEGPQNAQGKACF